MRLLVVSVMIAGVLAIPAAAEATQLSWQPCDGLALECATVSVPLDYRKPAGRRIDVMVSRKKSTNPAARRGVLLLNPGGPGNSGLDMPLQMAEAAPRSLTDAYDLIGFDPRGTGRSAPNTCALTPDQANLSKLVPYPAANGDIRQSVEYAREVAKQCFENSGDRLPFITTANTARDMDRIRVALGERKISYFGTSYGSYLGAVYTTLFPAQSDRILLDSVLDPRDLWQGAWRNWGPAIEERFGDLAAWMAGRDSTYGLGATPKAVRDKYFALAAKLDAHPVGKLTGNTFRALNRVALISDDNFPGTAQMWRALDRGETVPDIEFPIDQSMAATLWGVACNDAPSSRDVMRYQWDVLADRARNPISNGMPSNVWPCAFWPTRRIEPQVRITDRGPGNVLLTQNMRDPSTPVSGARAMRAALGDRARLATVNQGGHGSYLAAGNACVDRIGTDFLVSGVRPATDVHCGPEPRTARKEGAPHNRKGIS
ncbi:alpha/beta hydrolase [Actinosynnema sp. ALI-1.44]|uniref:alpha/beta hydrolase n=1 Tax=Actinosynnema sp. ALI-1.44 TaxID=1933779 RepID=UPI00143DB3CF|nr:alpha/beta hydrolase [Actinosynnema sp. ALI-1.44]